MQKTETHTITYIGVDEVTASVAATQTPSGRLGGLHHHDARKWREFFVHYEPFYQQCAGAAHRLVAALNDIRHADLQGLPTRRQLYAQHRALSRALMDSELHNLRKRSATTMTRLQELAKSINFNGSSNHKINGYCTLKSKATNGGVAGVGVGAGYYSSSSTLNRNKIMGVGGSSYSFNYQGNQNNKSQISHNVAGLATKSSSSSSASAASSSVPANVINSTGPTAKSSINPTSRLSATATATSNLNGLMPSSSAITTNMDVAIRLQKVTLLYNEIDRAAKRLEQLTEQRREHLRELTRQRALEDEMNEVSSQSSSSFI